MFGLPLYRRNEAAPSTPIKRGSNGLAYEMRKKRQNKREGKRERRKQCGIKPQKTKTKKKKQKKKKKKKTSPCAYIFPP